MTSFIRASLLVGCLTLAARETLAIVPAGQTPMPAPNGATKRLASAPDFDWITASGAGAVALMLLCRGHHRNFPRAAFGTSAFAMIASAYGFASGAWPLGIALAVYSIAILIGALQRKPAARRAAKNPARRAAAPYFEESRMSRLFGN